MAKFSKGWVHLPLRNYQKYMLFESGEALQIFLKWAVAEPALKTLEEVGGIFT